MKPVTICKSFIYIIAIISFCSCSTTKVIPDGDSRLRSNKIIVNSDEHINVSTLVPYLKQKPNNSIFLGFNPFMSIYNWGAGRDNWWGRFTRRIGQSPVVFDSSLVYSSEKNLFNHLTYEGYYNSIVSDTVITKNKLTDVIYNIDPGHKYVIDTIYYKFQDPEIGQIYLNNLNSASLFKGAYLSESLLENESQRATAIIRDSGYFNFSKYNFFFTADTTSEKEKHSATLHVNINNYTRNENPKDSKLQHRYYFNKVNVKLLPFTSIVETSMLNDSTYKVSNDSVSYDNINLLYPSGKPLIRPKVFSRLNLIAPGSRYNEKIVQHTYTRFSSIQLFSSVNFQMDPVDSNRVNTNINITPSSLQGYKLSLEASSNSSELIGISPGISYYHKNLFRGGEVFNINFSGNFQFKPKSNIHSNEFGISASIKIPNFLLLNDKFFRGSVIPSTEVSAVYNYQQRPEYTRNIISGTYGYSWSVRKKFFYKINPIQINIVKIFNISESFYESLKDPFLKNSYQDHFDIGMGTNFYFTTDANTPHNKSYFYLRWSNDISGNLISLFNGTLTENANGDKLVWGSPYSQYFKTEASVVYTFVMGKKSNRQIAVRFLGGIGKGYGNSISMPFEKLFWAGGAYGLRGWQARTVGPGYSQLDTAFTIPNQTGDIKLEANIEYRFPIAWVFDGAAFVDAGNVWNIKQHDNSESTAGLFKFKNFYKHIAVDWGIGLRLNLGFTLLRLDLGLKTFNPATDSWVGPAKWLKKGNYGLQFGVDYPF